MAISHVMELPGILPYRTNDQLIGLFKAINELQTDLKRVV